MAKNAIRNDLANTFPQAGELKRGIANTWDYFNKPLSGQYFGINFDGSIPYENLINPDRTSFLTNELYGFIAPQDTPNKNGVTYIPKLIAGDPYVAFRPEMNGHDKDVIYLLNLRTKKESKYPYGISVGGGSPDVKNIKRMNDILSGNSKQYKKRDDTPLLLDTLYDKDDYANTFPQWAEYLQAGPYRRGIRIPSSRGRRQFIR